MVGLGTLVNGAAILAGGAAGMLLKDKLTPRFQQIFLQALGLSVIFLGAGGALAGMLVFENGRAGTAHAMPLIASLLAGALVGEVFNLERQLEKFGVWLKKTVKSEGDSRFIEGFLTASLTVCVGAMAIVGSLQDGLAGDPSLLYAKALLDLIVIAVLAAAFGKGVLFSVIPLVLLQGGVTALASVLQPFFTQPILDMISLIGSTLIFCVGINLMFDRKIRVANLLPSLLFAVLFGCFSC